MCVCCLFCKLLLVFVIHVFDKWWGWGAGGYQGMGVCVCGGGGGVVDEKRERVCVF